MTEELPYLAWAATAIMGAAYAPAAAVFALVSVLAVALAVWVPVRAGGFVDRPARRVMLNVTVDTTAIRAATDRALATTAPDPWAELRETLTLAGREFRPGPE